MFPLSVGLTSAVFVNDAASGRPGSELVQYKGPWKNDSLLAAEDLYPDVTVKDVFDAEASLSFSFTGEAQGFTLNCMSTD